LYSASNKEQHEICTLERKEGIHERFENCLYFSDRRQSTMCLAR
jgi:hypothetical protein